jgi:DNA (cytosine-5)-methyltransferase 1
VAYSKDSNRRRGECRSEERAGAHEERRERPSGSGEDGQMGYANRPGPQPGREASSIDGHGSTAVADGCTCGVGHASGSRLQGDEHEVVCRSRGGQEGRAASQPGEARGYWDDFDTVICKHPSGELRARRVEPGTFPLADGVPARVGKLRAYGNAIVPWVAARFVKAYLELRK